jgi:hypothetical protein
LHSARAGKSNYKEESKDSFNHGRERKQTAGLPSTYFRGGSKYPTLRFMGVSVELALKIKNAIGASALDSRKLSRVERRAGLR